MAVADNDGTGSGGESVALPSRAVLSCAVAHGQDQLVEPSAQVMPGSQLHDNAAAGLA
jgi:hypothetical protein